MIHETLPHFLFKGLCNHLNVRCVLLLMDKIDNGFEESILLFVVL